MIRKIGWTIFIIFTAINVLAFVHAYKLTHFTRTTNVRTPGPDQLTPENRARVLLTGVNNPKPTREKLPATQFKTVTIKSDVKLEAWHITTSASRGTVIMFHSYSEEKSSLLPRAEEFIRLGYNVFLVDFMGSGGSEGECTNLGYTESREVKDAFEFLHLEGEKNIHLFGVSMGAVAILKAIDDYRIEPASIILECPFGSLYQAIKSRFEVMGVPAIPLAGMLTFWGGFQQGYWAFSHRSTNYAENVTMPVLMLYGGNDNRVSRGEIDAIYNNLAGEKSLIVYPDAGHDLYSENNREQWANDISRFIEQYCEDTERYSSE